jgi:hypothetical protein
VVGSGADVVAEDFLTDGNPGDVRTFRPTVVNSGDEAAPIVGIFLFDDPFTRLTQRYSNCRYLDGDFGTVSGYCEFTLNLGPGEGVRVSADTAVGVRVQPDAPHRFRVGASYTVDALDSPLGGDLGEPGDGPQLKLEPFTPAPDRAAFDIDFNDNFGSLAIHSGPNPSDMAATGASISGGVGSVVPVTVTIANNGPAYVFGALDGAGLSPDAPNQPAATVHFPDTVEVVSLPPKEPREGGIFCAPIINGRPDYTRSDEVIGRDYRCTDSADIPVGTVWTIAFTVRITNTRAETGTVVASGGYDDPVTANNTADIAVNAGSAGGLPVTGSNVGVIAGLGVLCLLTGALLYIVTLRRRRFVGLSHRP